MDIRIRRLIMTIFLLFFVITAPLLLLYASGYRYDFTRGRLQRTGNIFLEAPSIRSAYVYIDNQLYRETLSNKIFVKNILPGEYTVNITKDGRYPWSKTLLVQPGLTTFVKDIVLFLISEPIQLTQQPMTKAALSPLESTLAYTLTTLDITELYSYSLKDGASTLISRFDTDKILLTWSPSGKILLAQTKDTAFSIENGNTITSYDTTPYTSLRFNEITDQLIGITPSSIVALTENETPVYTTTNTILDALATSNTYYILEETPTNTNLVQFNKTFNDSVVLDSFPKESSYQLIQNSNQYLTLKNTRSNTIYLFKKPSLLGGVNFQLSTRQFNAKHAVFSSDGSKLLLSNEYEVSYYDTGTNQLQLIDRLSTPIKEVVWYGTNHIILLFDSKIVISDLNTNNTSSQITIVENGQALENLHLIGTTTIIYTGILGEKTGLFTNSIY